MKDISKLGSDLETFKRKLEQNLIKAQQDTAKTIKESVIEHLGSKSGKYVDSIQVGKTQVSSEKISTEIYTDLQSQDGYLVGRMIENGTGIYALEPHIGHTKTFFESEYQYWYVPANEVDRPVGRLIEINGQEFYIAKAQRPKPHWKPALDENIAQYKENISKAIKEAKK